MAEEDEGEGRKNRTKDYATPPTCGTETVGGVMIRKCQIEVLSESGRARRDTHMPILTVKSGSN